MNYLFSGVNSGVEMQNPSITVSGITNHMDGTCSVSINVAISPAPQSKSAKFIVALPDLYNYTGLEPITANVEEWALIEIAKFEV